MSIDLIAIEGQTKVVAVARERLAKACKDYASIKGLCGQVGYDIMIGGVRISVAEMDSRSYMAKLIRGRDMLHLGSLKVLDAVIDSAKERLDAEERKLATLARGGEK